MADYISTYRSNMFHVTDEAAYEQLLRYLRGEDLKKVTEIDKNDGRTKHCIYGSGPLCWYKPADEIDTIKTMLDNGEPLFDDKDKQLTYEEIRDAETLYDKNGDLVLDIYDRESDFDEFLNRMQKLLPENEAFVLITSGHEKCRIVDGDAVFVTNKTTDAIHLMTWVRKTSEKYNTNLIDFD